MEDVRDFVHPLDPLGPAEIKAAANAIRNVAKQRKLPTMRFNTITLKVSFGPAFLTERAQA